MNNQPKLTIARVIARLNIGGPAIQAILMTEAFRRKGHRSVLITGEVSANEGSMEYSAIDKGIVPIKIGSLSRSISWTKDPRTVWKLVRILIREKPVVIHTHTAKAGTVGRLAAMIAGVPIRVHTFHGHVFQGYFSPYITRIFLIIERFLARYTDRIIAVSASQKHDLAEVYRIAPPEKISVIPLGFDLDPFLRVNGRVGGFRRTLGCGSDSFLVGWVGRLTGIKDPHLFLSVAKLLSTQDETLRFALIGDGELRERCERQLKEAELTSRVAVAGWQEHLDRIYADLDVIVCTSINEGTPVALLEAMASGRPFVATDVGGVRDLMVGSRKRQSSFEVFDNGILVPRNPQSLAAAIRYLADNREFTRAMGQAGREFVRDRFSSRRLADDLEELYLSVARAKKMFRKEAFFQVAKQQPQCNPSERAHS